MPKPNTLRQQVREDTERAINRRLEQQQLTEEAVDRALEEWETDSYEEFFADCRQAGEDTSRCGALWTRLKEMGDVPTDEGGDVDPGNDEAPAAAEPALPVPETVEQIEDAFVMADQAYLVVTTGCPTCNEAKEELSDWIDEGLLEVVNVQESDKGADIVMETGLDALPAMVIEEDDEYITV